MEKLGRYNQRKSAQIIASEYKDINAKISILDIRDDVSSQKKGEMQKELLG